MSETETAEAPAKTKRPPAERTMVAMSDGTSVEFVGKTKMVKSVNEDGSVRFDFRNGYCRTVTAPDSLYAKLVGHGLSQKCGDSGAGESDVDDMQIAFDATADRIEAGEWGVERKGGDGFSGASVVLRAVAEVKGITVAKVKEWVEKRLAKAKDAGEDLTRQDLYKSFKKPGTRTAAVIERLEKEKLTASAKLDGDELLDEIDA